ncbi:MAG TPA: YidB family protein [Methyloceanibacter sp.]|jgi:uncharacterized protein YidB (DUF937 family)|nr:YidB family protein [Methyloceanibacter sp.]
MADIFGSDKGPALPGGSVAKPLIIALLALLASRYFGGKKEEPAPEMPKLPEPQSGSDPSPGSILDGLGGLIKQFQQKGLGDTVDSWISTGKNKNVAPDQVSVALGGDVVDELSRRTGLTRDQVVAELSRMLPNVVDKLTPDGRLPTRQEVMRLMS